MDKIAVNGKEFSVVRLLGKEGFTDYECNDYSEECDFEHWGEKFWTGEEPI